MSNNTVNIRTCSDSCSALLQLIQYIAADGDLAPSYEQEEPDTTKTPSVSARSNCNIIREDLGKLFFLEVGIQSNDYVSTNHENHHWKGEVRVDFGGRGGGLKTKVINLKRWKARQVTSVNKSRFIAFSTRSDCGDGAL